MLPGGVRLAKLESVVVVDFLSLSDGDDPVGIIASIVLPKAAALDLAKRLADVFSEDEGANDPNQK